MICKRWMLGVALFSASCSAGESSLGRDGGTASAVDPDDASLVDGSSPSDEPVSSCHVGEADCPNISDEAKAFSDEYCALIAPCCTDAGLGSQCAAKLYHLSEIGGYRDTNGVVCLEALRARASRADFCEGLEPQTVAQWPYVIRECEPVLPDLGGALFNSSDLPTTTEAGHACVGTRLRTFGPAAFSLESYADNSIGRPSEGVLCAHEAGLFCDAATRTCVTTLALGESCTDMAQCAADGFCDYFGTGGTCAPRLALGARCEGGPTECAGPAYCTEAFTCAVLAKTGEPCVQSSEPGMSWCASGACVDDVCVDALAAVCGPSPRPGT